MVEFTEALKFNILANFICRQHESKSLTEHYESIVHDLRFQVQSAHQKIDDLNDQMVKSSAVKTELVHQIGEEKKAQARAHILLQNAESRSEGAIKQVQNLLSKENEILSEKKTLSAFTGLSRVSFVCANSVFVGKEVDRLKMDRERLERNLTQFQRLKETLDNRKGVSRLTDEVSAEHDSEVSIFASIPSGPCTNSLRILAEHALRRVRENKDSLKVTEPSSAKRGRRGVRGHYHLKLKLRSNIAYSISIYVQMEYLRTLLPPLELSTTLYNGPKRKS